MKGSSFSSTSSMTFSFDTFPTYMTDFQKTVRTRKIENSISEGNNKVWSLYYFPFKYYFYN